MPTVLLLTCADHQHQETETARLAEHLIDRGAAAQVIPWSAPRAAELDAELVVIRSTWDYTSRLGEFLAFLESRPASVANPLDVVKWNCHKGYLTELAAAGVPVVPTVLVRAGGTELPPVAADELIIKPAVSAGAIGVGRFPVGSVDAATHLQKLTAVGDALVQPFLPEVVTGERSLMFIGGRFSHAVCKVPAEGDFRVQHEFGGVSVTHHVCAAELAVAQAALSLAPGGDDLLYARVDLVGPADHPLVMELELIEPELFLHFSPTATQLLADEILARI